MSEWQSKCWGRTRVVHSCGLYSRHELQVRAGTYCSLHYHKARANRFVCASGRIAVVTLFGNQLSRHILTSDMTYDVPSLVVHQFQAISDGAVFEEYWPDRGGEIDDSDIVRLATGGVLHKNDTWDELVWKLLKL